MKSKIHEYLLKGFNTQMSKKIFTFIIVLSVSLFIFNSSSAAARLVWHPAGVNTNWSNANNWRLLTYSGSTASTAPLAVDTAELGNSTTSFTVVLDVDTSIAVLIYSGSGQLFLNTSTSKTLRVTGNIFLNNVSQTGGGSATIKITGTGTQTLTGSTTGTGYAKLCNLTIDKSGGSLALKNNITFGGSTKLKYTAGTLSAGTSTTAFYLTNTIEGNFTLKNVEFMGNSSNMSIADTLTVDSLLVLSGSSNVKLNTNTIKLNGDLLLNNSGTTSYGGTATIVWSGTANQKITSTVAVATGYLPNVKLVKSSGTVTLKGNISVSGDWTNNYSASPSTIICDSSNVVFYSAGTPNIAGSYATPFWDLSFSFSSGGNSIFNIGTTVTPNASVSHTLTIAGTGYAKLNNGTLNVTGNILLTNTYAAFNFGTATVKINGTGSQSITGASASGKHGLPNVTIDKSSGTLTLSNYIPVNALTYTQGTLSVGSSTIEAYGNLDGQGTSTTPEFNNVTVANAVTLAGNLKVSGNLTINSFSTLNTSGSNYAIDLKGNLTNNGTLTANSSTLTFTGSSAQSLAGSNASSAYKVVMDKSADSLTLNKSLTLTNNLTLTSGKIISTSANLLTLNDNATVTGGSNSSFVAGPLKKVGNDGFKFPVGKGSSYKPDSISAPSSTSDAFTSEYIGAKSSYTTLDGVLTYISPCEHWTLDHTAGSATINVKLFWNSPCFYIPSLTYLKVGYLNSTTWTTAGTCTTTGNTTTGTVVTGTARSTWTDITLSKTNPLVVAHAGSDAAICSGSSASIGGSPTGSGGTTSLSYSWSPATGLSSSTVANPTCSATATTTYIVTVTDAISEYAKDTVLITVNTKPVAHAGSDVAICLGSSTSIGATATSGTPSYSYSWSPSTGLSSSTIATPTASPTTTTSYVVTVTDANSCTGKDTVNVTVNSLPTAHAGADAGLCMGSGITIGASPAATGGSSPYAYLWSPSASLTSSTTAQPTASPTVTTTFALRVTDVNGCIGRDTIIITLHSLPSAHAGHDTTICYGASVTIGASPAATGGAGSYTYVWSPTDSLSSSTIAQPTANPIVSTEYILTVSDANSCEGMDTMELTVNPQLFADAGTDETICVGEEVVLGNENVVSGGTPLYAFYWYNPDTVYSREIYVDYYPSNKDTFILVVMDSAHCYARDTVKITAHPAVSIDAGTDTIIPFKGSIILGGSPTISGGTSPYFLKWAPSDFLDDSTLANPTITDLINTVVYNLYVSDTFGCYATQNINVHPDFPEADSSMHFSLLSGGNITVTDSSYVFEKVGAYGTISGLLFGSDSVWDGNPPVVNGALEDLDSLMDEIDAFTIKDTVTSDLAASSVRTTGIYYVKDSAVIDGDWTITGDASSMYIVCIQDSLIIQSHSRIILDGISPSQLVVYANKKIHAYGFSDLSGIFIARSDIKLDTVACPAAFRSLENISVKAIILNKLGEIKGRPKSKNYLIKSLTQNSIEKDLDYDNDLAMDFWGITPDSYTSGFHDINGDPVPAGVNASVDGFGGLNNPVMWKMINKIHPGYLESILDESWDWNNNGFYGERWMLYHNQTPSQLNEAISPEFLNSYEDWIHPTLVQDRQTDYKFVLDGLNAHSGLVFNMLGPSLTYNELKLNQLLDLNQKVNDITLGNELYGIGVHQSFYYNNAQQYVQRCNEYLDDIHGNANYNGIRVGVFAGAGLDNALFDDAGSFTLQPRSCKGFTLNAQMGLPQISLTAGGASPHSDDFFRLLPHDALVFHVTATSRLTSVDVGGIPYSNNNLPNINQIPQYFNEIYRTKKILSEETFKLLPPDIDAWITSYRNTEQDIAIASTWAHGLFAASLTFLLMEDNHIAKIGYHTMFQNYYYGIFFNSTDGFKDGLHPDYTPDQGIPTKIWGLTAVGLALSQIGEAMHNATHASKIVFTNNPPLSGTYPDDAIIGWILDGNDEQQAILINLSGAPYITSNPMEGVMGAQWVYQQIYQPENNPLVYIRGNDETAYEIYNGSGWVTVKDGLPSPNFPYDIQSKMVITNPTLFNPITTDILLPPYSITRVQMLLPDLEVENANVTIKSIPTSMTPGETVTHGSIRLMAKGAASYRWEPTDGLYGLTDPYDPQYYVCGSTVIASPTVSTTYTVFGFTGQAGASVPFSSTTVVVNVSAPPTFTMCNGGTLVNDGGVVTMNCGNPIHITLDCSTTCGGACTDGWSYWVSPTEGVYSDAPCTTNAIQQSGTTNADFYFKPLIKTDYVITAVDNAANEGSFTIQKMTVQPDHALTISYPAGALCADASITYTAEIDGAVDNVNYSYDWYYMDDEQLTAGGILWNQLTPLCSICGATYSVNPQPSSRKRILVKATAISGTCSGEELYVYKKMKDFYPKAIIDGGPQSFDFYKDKFCEGDKLHLEGQGSDFHVPNSSTVYPGDYSWAPDAGNTWYPGDGDDKTNITMPGSGYSNPVTITLTTTMDDGGGAGVGVVPCNGVSNTDQIRFEIAGHGPDISFSPSPPCTTLVNCPISLSAQATNFFTTATLTNATFTWLPTQYLSPPTGADVICTPLEVGTYTYTVIANDTTDNPYGCCKTAEFVVVAEPGFDTHVSANGPMNYTLCPWNNLIVDGSLTAPIGTTYQWYYSNGTPISGATNSSYNFCQLIWYSCTYTYYCLITLPGGCEVTSDIVDFCNSGYWRKEDALTFDSDNFVIKIYPNPTDNKVYLEIESEEKTGVNVSLLNGYGSTLFNQQQNLNEGANKFFLLLPSNISEGLYFLRVYNSKNQKTIKIIIDR